MSDLSDAVATLISSVEFDVEDLNTCCACGDSTREIVLCKILALPVTIAVNKTVTLQQLFEQVFNKRERIDVKCGEANCKGEPKIQRKNVQSVPLILVVQLLLYESSDNGFIAKIEKYYIKSIPTAKVEFGGSSYKVISAIFHIGVKSIEHGHYVSFVRYKKNWFQISNDVLVLQVAEFVLKSVIMSSKKIHGFI